MTLKLEGTKHHQPLLTMRITQEQPPEVAIEGVGDGSRDGHRLGQDKCWENPSNITAEGGSTVGCMYCQ